MILIIMIIVIVSWLNSDKTRKYDVEQDNDLLITTLFGPRSGLMVVLHRDFLIGNDTEDKYVKYSTNSVGLVVNKINKYNIYINIFFSFNILYE